MGTESVRGADSAIVWGRGRSSHTALTVNGKVTRVGREGAPRPGWGGRGLETWASLMAVQPRHP